MCLEIIYLIHIYQEDLVLNNQQWFICYKDKPNQIEFLEIELFDHLTVRKQMADVYLNFKR